MSKAMAMSLIGLSFLTGQTPGQLFEQGKAWFERGQLDSAEHRLIAAIEADPTFPEAYYVLGQVYLKRYDLDKTREYLRKAIEIKQQDQAFRDEFQRVNEIASLMANAMRALEERDPYFAIGKFEAVMAQFPEFSAVALYHMGLASTRVDEISEAARYFREANEMDPLYDKPRNALKGLADKIYNTGNQSFRRGDYEGAAERYTKVLEIDPEYYRAYFQLGLVSTKLGEYDRAVDRYGRAVAIEPAYAKGWFALGLAYQRNGDYDSALESLDSATRADPTYAKAYAQKGTIHLKLGDYASAEVAYNDAIQADPTYAKPYEDLGKILINDKKYGDAISSLMTATALNGNSSASWYMLAQSYNALGQCEEAKDAALSSVDVKSDYAPALFELGAAEICLGNKTAALNAFEKVRKDRSWRKAAEYEIDKIQNPEKYRNR